MHGHPAPIRFSHFCLTTEIRHGSRLYIVSNNNFDGRAQKGKDGYRSKKHSRNGIGLTAIAAVMRILQTVSGDAAKYRGIPLAFVSGSLFPTVGHGR